MIDRDSDLDDCAEYVRSSNTKEAITVKHLFRLFLTGFAAVLLVMALAITTVGQDLDRPEVKFEAKAIEDAIPPLYDVELYINGEGPKPIVTVERLNKSVSAEWRAKTIQQRLQQAWDALGSISEFERAYEVVKNVKFGVFVIGTSNSSPELPAHIMQADAMVYLTEGETPYRSLKNTLDELRNYLKNQGSNTKAPEEKKLNDQKSTAKYYYAKAMDLADSPAKMAEGLEYALSFNPEYPAVYERLVKALEDTGQSAKAKEVGAAYALLMKALPDRLKGDTAWDDGKYEEALADYKSATRAFPDCVTYYWLQSLVQEKLGRRAEAVSILNQAKSMLDTSKSYIAGRTRKGGWLVMLQTRMDKDLSATN